MEMGGNLCFVWKCFKVVLQKNIIFKLEQNCIWKLKSCQFICYILKLHKTYYYQSYLMFIQLFDF